MSEVTDKGADRETRLPKPCLRRTGRSSWCLLPDGHEADCHGVTGEELASVDFGPAASSRRRW